MKRKHITLPTLQIAAAAFLIMTCQANTYCVDGSSNAVVAENKCNGAQPGEEFTLVEGPPGVTPGSVIPKSPKEARSGHVSGGFGKRDNNNDDDDCDDLLDPVADVFCGLGGGS
jgi:hypothetical protein